VKRRLGRLLVAGGSGAVLALAWAPVEETWLAWVGLAPLLVLLRLDRGKGFVLETLLFGVTFLTVGCLWLYELTFVGGALMSLAATVLFFVPPAWILRTAVHDGRVPVPVAAPVVWVTFDWLRSWAFTGFPWLFLAHSQWESPRVTAISAWVGAYGLTFAMVGVNAGIAAVAVRILGAPAASRRARLGWLVPGAALLAVGLAAASWSPVEGERTLRVAVVQGNVPQRLKKEALEKGKESAGDVLRRHLELTRDAREAAIERWGSGPDLVIWPETMLPGRVDPEHPGWRPLFEEIVRTGDAPALVGALAIGAPDAGGRRVYNTALLLDRRGRPVSRYDKVHLVPGGEYVPLRGVMPTGIQEPLERWIRNFAGFLPSLAEGRRLEPVGGEDLDATLGPLICYEVIYPQLSLEHVRNGADVLVNLTNYGWFKESAQLDQALAITALRALETGRPLVVCANSGISASIGPDGRLRDVLEARGRRKAVAGYLLSELPIPPRDSRTVYVRIGDAFVILLAIVTAGLLALGFRGRMKGREAA
jgi:apolipoprotein N-acyltransferase